MTQQTKMFNFKHYTFGEGVRCVDGRLLRHDPGVGDPYLETDIGACPDWPGCGCERDLPKEDAWCDNIGREVHMKGDDEPPRSIVLPLAAALIAIVCISLALWALICLPLIYLLKAFGFW